MAQKFLTDIEVTRGLVDSDGDLGVAGQVLSSTGTGTNWITNEANSTVVYQDGFTGDNSTVDFTLSVSVTDENVTQVYIDGVYQTKDTYSVSNTTLTFSTAPPLNADIEVITFSTATTADDLQAGVMIIPVKNTHTASIAKGEPVYITGNVGSSARLQIAPADASNSAKMPAAGLLLQTLAVNAEGYVVTGGYLRNITTDTIDGTSTSSNDTVYVKSGGGLTMTKPTGTNLIQNIAKVARVASGNAGSLIVSSILRTNDVPNITNDYFWLGNSSGVATPTEFTSSVRGLISASGNAISYNSSTGVITANYEESPTFTGNVVIDGTTNSGRLFVEQSGADMIDMTRTSVGTYRLAISTSDKFSIYDVGAASDRLVIDSSGNVGINTTSPQEKLHVLGNGLIFGNLFLDGSANSFRAIAMNTSDGADNESIYLCGGGAASAARGALVGALGNEFSANAGQLVLQGGRVSTGNIVFSTGTTTTERMRIESDGTIQITNSTSPKLQLKRGSKEYTTRIDNVNKFVIQEEGGNEFFIVESGASSNSIRIDSSGNVGIGTTSPTHKLQIDEGSMLIEKNQQSGGTDHNFIQLVYNGSWSGNVNGLAAINVTDGYTSTNTVGKFGITYDGSQGKFVLTNLYNGGYGASGDVFTVRANGTTYIAGNVGIGTASPVVKLNVVGSAYFSGNDAWNGGGSEANKTDIALIIDEGDTIYTRDSNQYLRTLIKKDTGDNIQIGEAGTSLIDNINFFSGSSCSYTWYNNSSAAMKLTSTGLGIGTTSPGAKLNLYHATDDVSINVNTGTGGSYPKKTGISFGATSTSLSGDAKFTGGAGIQAINTAASGNPTNLTFWTNSTGTPTVRMSILNSGEFCIGTTETAVISTDVIHSIGQILRSTLSSSAFARLVMQERQSNWISFVNGSGGHFGTIAVSGSGVSYGSNSDYRLKENIIQMTGALDRIAQLKPSRFNFIAEPEKTVDGFLAHEVQNIVPEAVTGEQDGTITTGNIINSNGDILEENVIEPETLEIGTSFEATSTQPKYQQLDPAKLVPLLVGAIQELKAEVETLKLQING